MQSHVRSLVAIGWKIARAIVIGNQARILRYLQNQDQATPQQWKSLLGRPPLARMAVEARLGRVKREGAFSSVVAPYGVHSA
jgi:hypothetical protein